MSQQVQRGKIAAAWFLGLGLLWAVALANEPQDAKPIGDSTGGSLRFTAPGDAPPQAATEYGPRGRYQMLLRKIEVPDDHKSYGDFYDYGYYAGTSYAGHNDLPAGYWVYVSPHWLIYRDAGAPGAAPAKVAWNAMQATGKPDSLDGGDVQTAWASASQDGQREWLELTYGGEYEAVGVIVYENYNPGAVDSVDACVGNNERVQVWAGKDPIEPGKLKGVSMISFSTPVKTKCVRLNIDSQRVPGWNEIDAVGLLDKEGNVHWATSATASSSYGATPVDPSTNRLRLLDGEIERKSP